MSFRGQKGTDPFSTKTSRHERFAQMSQQELLIEQKKREIQAKLAQKQKESDSVAPKGGLQVAGAIKVEEKPTLPDAPRVNRKPQWRGGFDASKWKKPNQKTTPGMPTSNLAVTSTATSVKNNLFANDGSFLDQFKKVAEAKVADQQLPIPSVSHQLEPLITPNQTIRPPSPYSPTHASPDSSPQSTPQLTPQFTPGVPPPPLMHMAMPPDMSQPPPMPGTLMAPNIHPPVSPANIPPHSIPPPVLLASNMPPVTTSIMPSMQTIVNLPPPAVLANQPPPLLSMNIPPPHLTSPPPALPNANAMQFPFNLPSGPPPMATTAPPVTSTPVSLPALIPPPALASFPPATAAPPPMAEVSPTALSGNSSNPALTAAMAQLARMVAEGGDDIEDMARERNRDDPTMWFLYQKESAAYKQYRDLVERIKAVKGPDTNSANISAASSSNLGDLSRPKKKRSRWGDQVDTSVSAPTLASASVIPPQPIVGAGVPNAKPLLSKVTRTDPNLLAYAQKSYNTTQLSEEEWKKCEDHYKVHLLYHDMLRKREQLAKLERAGKHKYEYDSDEETEGGTWEHKLRSQEMEATERWADELTRQAEGKHHIGDFLPPNELTKFMEKYNARKEGREPDLSDYKEYKLKEDNIGFKMLQKLGWSEGQGLGSEGQGITDPVNKATVRNESQGLGLERPEEVEGGDDEYEAYRKRMMLAYRFRPNPLNNPRRSYY